MVSEVTDAAAIPVTFWLLGILAKNPLLSFNALATSGNENSLLITILDVVVSVATLYKMQGNKVKYCLGLILLTGCGIYDGRSPQHKPEHKLALASRYTCSQTNPYRLITRLQNEISQSKAIRTAPRRRLSAPVGLPQRKMEDRVGGAEPHVVR